MKTQVRARHAAIRTQWIDKRLASAAFIAETPIDEPLDDLMNMNALQELVAAPANPPKGPPRTKSNARQKAMPKQSATSRTCR